MDNKEKLASAYLSLEGLSLGDAFGARCFTGQHAAETYPGDRAITMVPPPWYWTDDTEMAIVIFEQLCDLGEINCDDLARRFAQRYEADPRRGYGFGARKLLEQITAGKPWQKAASSLFNGEGSIGNGAAMRIAPLGAYFSHDLDLVAAQAMLSAKVTHAHIDGQAGAIAIALAAAIVKEMKSESIANIRAKLFSEIIQRTPAGPTKEGIISAADIPIDTPLEQVLIKLKIRFGATCVNTVPFCIWSIAKHLGFFGEALWRTAAAGGDHDTNCAMVGGVLALYSDLEGIPKNWLAAREPLALTVDIQ